MLDIDRFKSINDRFGHRAGDNAIVAFAGALRETLRDSDVLGRLGGEEFAVVLPNADEQAAQETAERVRAAVQNLQVPVGDEMSFGFTVSIGFAALGARPVSLDNLIAEADKALYQAKATGRNRVVAHHLLPMLD